MKHKFTPQDLKNGMFGITVKRGRFVVVDDGLVFQDGSYSNIASWDDNFNQLGTGDKIIEVYDNVRCFVNLYEPYKRAFKPLYKWED